LERSARKTTRRNRGIQQQGRGDADKPRASP
jgi:hypothetical protein